MSALQLGHRWWSRIVGWCRIGQCAEARPLVVKKNCRVMKDGICKTLFIKVGTKALVVV